MNTEAFTAPFSVRTALGNISSLTLLTSAFGILCILSVLLTSVLLISTGRSIVDEILHKAANQAEQAAQNEIEHFLQGPDVLIKYILNAIEDEYVLTSDIESFQRLLWNSPGRGKLIAFSSIYYANSEGELIGLGSRNLEWPLVDWTFSLSSAQTNGNYTIVDPTQDGMLSDKRFQLSQFDTRSRPWFKAAISSNGRPAWGELYNDYESEKLTLSRAQASLNAKGEIQGVVGVDMHIRHLRNFLSEIPLNENAEIFLVDSSGLLVASNEPTLNTNQKSLVNLHESQHLRFSSLAAQVVSDELGGFSRVYAPYQRNLTLDGEKGHFYIAPIGREHGLNWTLGMFLPESDYSGSISEHVKHVGSMLLLIVITGCGVIAGFIYLVVKPIMQLRTSAALIANGEFEVAVDVDTRNEVGDLGRSIDSMRRRLQHSFCDIVEQKRLAQTTLDSIGDGILSIDVNYKITFINPVACRLLGVLKEEVVGDSIDSVFKIAELGTGNTQTCQDIVNELSADQKFLQEVLLCDTNERSRPVHCRLSVLTSTQGERKGLVAILSDLTEEHRLKEELLFQSKHDYLTRLVNRQEFERCLQKAIVSTKGNSVSHALCFIDLDRFKMINDSGGHDAGDELLRQVARFLSECSGKNDTVARVGGDEFGVLIEHCSLSDAESSVESLRSILADDRFFWNDRSYQISLSAGLVSIDKNTGSLVTLMRDADSACYVAKQAGRNCIHVAHPDSHSLKLRQEEYKSLEQIKFALENNLFDLYVQFIEPAVIPDTNSALHVEILLRMRTETNDMILPDVFLPIAEKFGLLSSIDRWVVSHAFLWISENVNLMNLHCRFSINISGQSLGDVNFHDFMEKQLKSFNAPESTLCFEVTETSAIADMASALKLLKMLRQKGCKIALDDFGSGLCSFAYLKKLPIDYLKIDGQFIVDILDDPINIAMVKSINDIGQSLGILTVAEFVDSNATREEMQKLGVDFVQGYLFGEPYPLMYLCAGERAIRSSSRRQYSA